MKEFAVYTVARLGLFTHSVVLLWPLLLAAVVSGVASFYLLAGPRNRFAAQVDARATNMARRFEEARAKEDQD